MSNYSYTKERLIQYCEENNIELKIDYSDKKIMCNTIIEGKCLDKDCTLHFKNLLNIF